LTEIPAFSPEGLDGYQQQASSGIFLVCVNIVFGRTIKPIDPAYQQSVDKWKSELLAGRKQRAAIGRIILAQARRGYLRHRCENALVFPKAQPKPCSFELNGTDITLKLSEGTQATVQGKPVSTTKLEPDTSKTAP
jgi:hypothetical protein